MSGAIQHDCASCAHARMTVRGEAGQIRADVRSCRRNPPQMVVVPTGPGQLQIQSLFPVVSNSDYGCSEFKLRLQAVT